MPRPPKSKEQHKRDGTYQRVRHADRKEFELLKNVPPAPAGFDATRKKYWVHFCDKLITTGLLTIQHLDSVEALCNLRADLDELNRDIKANGITFMTKTGQVKANPAYGLKLQTQAQILRIYEQFGFTPRTSMTLKAPKVQEKEKDPFEAVLEMMNGKKNKRTQAKA